jgi:hypothetical protein
MTQPSSPEIVAAALVKRFEYESMALHKVQRDWLVREIGDALRGNAQSPRPADTELQPEYAQEALDTTDVRWAVNVLLEKIAEKFDAWDTYDLFRSEASSTVRSFKHDLATLTSTMLRPSENKD